LAVGYCTLYGDMCGGLAVISDVPKTMIYRLARWINRERELIPPASITKPPSAELRPNQTDQDSLPPYEVLDAILERYVVEAQSVEDIVRAGYDPAIVSKVSRLIDSSEYKRRQAAPGLKVTSKAFDGFRLRNGTDETQALRRQPDPGTASGSSVGGPGGVQSGGVA
jgi:NAD+ synthetase